MKTRIEICKICGLCYGAQRALDLTIEQAKNRKNVVLFKQLLHNKYTVDKLLSLGVSQKDKLEDITNKDFVILRAHGEEKSTYNYLKSHQINFLDCTCPNVLNIIKHVYIKNAEGYKILIIGKYGKESGQMHPEVKAIAGWCENPILIEDADDINKITTDNKKYFLVIQTTFPQEKSKAIINKIKSKLKKLKRDLLVVDTTCKAQLMIKRQSLRLAKKVNVMLVIGGSNSSNTKELYYLLKKVCPTFFVETKEDIYNLIKQKKVISGQYIGLTAGASTTKEEIINIKKILDAL